MKGAFSNAGASFDMIPDETIDFLTSLFQARYGFVVGTVRRYAPSKDLVDDIIQDVYCDFVTGAAEGRWDLQQDVGPLLCQIAKRKAQTQWRQHEQRRRAVDRIAEHLLESVGRNREKDDKAYERIRSEAAALELCIGKLPPKSRAIVEQHYFNGTAMKIIAEQQETTPATIKNFFYRVRLKLKDCIEQTLKRQ